MFKENKSNCALFLVLLLMVPFKSLYVYYALSFILIFIFTFNERLIWNLPAKILATAITFYCFMFAFRFLTTFEPIVRDYVEVFRFFPLLYLIMKINYFKKICYDDIVRASFVYLLIDGSVTFLQFFNFNFLGIIDIVHTFYTSDGFFASDDMTVTNRSPGISAQIGAHGAILMSTAVIMLLGIMLKCHSRWLSQAGLVISLVLLILTQSRTSFVATFILSIFVNIGMWFERFVIIVTSLHRDFLPSSWTMFSPTFIDIGIFLGTIGFFFVLFLMYARAFPVVAQAELKSILKSSGSEYKK